MHIHNAIEGVGRLPGGGQLWVEDFIFRGDMKPCRNWDFEVLAQITLGPSTVTWSKMASEIEPQKDWMPLWTSQRAGSITEDRIVAPFILRSREHFVIPQFHISFWTLSYCTWWTQPNTHRSGIELAGRVYWFNFVWLFDVPSWSSHLLCCGLNT